MKYFEDYADLLLSRYSDRVKYWSTFNEPIIICQFGYGNPDRAPLVYAPGVGVYLCSHHLLIAHSKVYDSFHVKFFIQSLTNMHINQYFNLLGIALQPTKTK